MAMYQDKKTDKERLFSKIRNEEVTLFIGSGFSLRGGAPSARDIINAIKKECPEIEQTELKDVARDYVQRLDDDREKLIDLVQNLFPRHSICDDNQKALIRLPHFRKIFTTNYDSFIEDAYAEKCLVIREERDLTQCSDNLVQIYKLHGDFVNKEGLVITEDDYNDFFENKKNSLIWAPLKLAMMNTHMVFIGYSLDDSNVFRILQHIETICGAEPREMYMIAPSTEKYKANRLKRHNIKWIQSTAEDFLRELEQVISDTIFADYSRKKVSHQTFIEYCHIHGINPSIREKKEGNDIVNIEGYNGKPVLRNISIRTRSNPLENFDFEKSGPIIEEGPLKGKYAIQIPVSNIDMFESRVNGIKEVGKENIQNVYLAPTPMRIQVKIKIPGRGFIKSTYCSVLQMSLSSFSYTFDLDICTFVLTISIDDNNIIQSKDIRVETKDVYKDNENAMQWIELLDAIFSGEKVLFPELGNLELHTKSQQNHPFKWFKKYYEYVRIIELHSHTSFTQYNNFTPERFEIAQKLYHWLTQQPLQHTVHNGACELTFEFANELESNELVNISPEHSWGMAISKDIAPILFNGITYTIPYDYLYFNNCNVVKVEKQSNGNIKMLVRNNASVYHEFLTSSPQFSDYASKDLITVSVHEDITF